MDEIGPASDDEGVVAAEQYNISHVINEEEGNAARAGEEHQKVDPAWALNLKPEVDEPNQMNIPNLITFTIAELKAYTEGFHEGNKVGQEPNHRVYQGRISGGHKRLNGKDIAVKMYRKMDEEIIQWEAEIRYLPTFRHKNIIKLLGKCETSTRLYLIYPLMKNGSVQQRVTNLDWGATIKILLGSTSALKELHKHNLVYRDFKPGNILLDEDLKPILSNFGLVVNANTYCVSGGTVGYTEPRAIYGQRKEAKIENDVYSLGVLIFQLLMRSKDVVDPNEDIRGPRIIDWAITEYRERRDAVHPDLKSTGCTGEAATKLTRLGIQCISEPLEDRPTVSRVLQTISALDSRMPDVIKLICLPFCPTYI